jgi:hypothetical protein
MSGPRASKLALAAVCAGLLAGCGHTEKVSAGHTLRIGLSEYRLNPSQVHAGPGLITVQVHNYGRLKHDLLISRDGQTTVFVEPLSPGQSTQVMVYFDPGKYSMSSTVLDDNALGTYGTLTVGR